MFKKILIANRGEIALRVISTLREMGIKTVAVYSEADKTAAHRLAADESVFLGPAEPAESYLHIDRIISAAKAKGAEAIHPGYGFLAENAAFALRCQKEGLVFIGPPAEVIRDLGDKTIARKTMLENGVPVIPGMDQVADDPGELAVVAQNIGFPVLIKAAAGGGGKGMRVVERAQDLAGACEIAAREAASAFGNGGIYLEKYIAKPRHVEIQILADAKGNTIHLLERECSIQRRHQKIIEETPSPALNEKLRQEMGAAAVKAAKASGYVNAGTVEFLLDQEGTFYFLEVNTRIQVEHPITEMITGLDLVRLQIEIAAGSELRIAQRDVRARGHAIECRIYGEDPENNFMPSSGKILFMNVPSGPGIRNDSGVYSGFTVPLEYDPILSKLIVHAEDRQSAIRKMGEALSEYIILGVKTPIPFLKDVLKSEAFQAGETYTDFIDTHLGEWRQDDTLQDFACMAFIIDELTGKPQAGAFTAAADEMPTPWKTLGKWRG